MGQFRWMDGWAARNTVLRRILRVHSDSEGESTAQEQEWWVTCHRALPDSAAAWVYVLDRAMPPAKDGHILTPKRVNRSPSRAKATLQKDCERVR